MLRLNTETAYILREEFGEDIVLNCLKNTSGLSSMGLLVADSQCKVLVISLVGNIKLLGGSVTRENK